MNTPNLPKLLLSFSALTILLLTSCSKTEDTMENAAACEYYLAGLSFQCNEDNCEYVATLEHDSSGAKSEISIDKATYDHYKAIADEKGANVCWEGELQ